MVLNEWG